MKQAVRRADIQSFFGQRFGTDLTIREKATPEHLPCGIAHLTIPRGTMTEISGPPSSGCTSILNAIMARVTRRPEFCALIDASGSFDPCSASEAGVQLSHLLWARCLGDAEKALKAADLLVQAGGFGVVALDLAGIQGRDARRISLASWFRLRHAVERTPTALIVVGHERYTASCSTLQIESHHGGVQIKDGLLRGLTANAVIGPRNRIRTTFTLNPLYRK